MIVHMKHTRHGCENGFNVNRYDAGKTYDVTRSLALEFLRNDYAIRSASDEFIKFSKKVQTISDDEFKIRMPLIEIVSKQQECGGYYETFWNN